MSPLLNYKPLQSGYGQICGEAAVRLQFVKKVTLLTYKPLWLLCGFKIV